LKSRSLSLVLCGLRWSVEWQGWLTRAGRAGPDVGNVTHRAERPAAGLIVQVGGGIVLYLLATAVVAVLGGLLRILYPTVFLWKLGTVVLFGNFIHAFGRRGAFGSTLIGLGALLAAIALTGFSALCGLAVLVNVWEALGIPH
jgi:hypothetical protein